MSRVLPLYLLKIYQDIKNIIGHLYEEFLRVIDNKEYLKN